MRSTDREGTRLHCRPRRRRSSLAAGRRRGSAESRGLGQADQVSSWNAPPPGPRRGNEVFKHRHDRRANDNVPSSCSLSPATSSAISRRPVRPLRKSGRGEAGPPGSRRSGSSGRRPSESRRSPRRFMIRLGASNSLRDETIQIWQLPPAHTDGDSRLSSRRRKVLHMGDMGSTRVHPGHRHQGGRLGEGIPPGARQGAGARAGRRRRHSGTRRV